METSDLTIRVLQEIRDGIRVTNERLERSEARAEVRHAEVTQQFLVMNQRFEVIETTLRDLAEQLVMLARGVKTAVENRGLVEQRLEEHARRLAELEKKLSA
ncbi:MAG: hypothetical protein SFW67_16570 [Myxococcaceae bacterium]|nr:hypothetical protein [Myxococcaceae bacterium]